MAPPMAGTRSFAHGAAHTLWLTVEVGQSALGQSALVAPGGGVGIGPLGGTVRGGGGGKGSIRIRMPWHTLLYGKFVNVLVFLVEATDRRTD